MDTTQLVRYNAFLRRRFAEFFTGLDWAVLSEDHGTSHSTIANVFMHACNMEDWWIHYVLPGKAWDGPAWDGFTSAEAMLRRVEEVERKTEAFLDGLKPGDLQRTHRLNTGGDEEAAMTLEQLLVEVVMEETHHRGEILAMLWRKDIAPPYVSFAQWAADEGPPIEKAN